MTSSTSLLIGLINTMNNDVITELNKKVVLDQNLPMEFIKEYINNVINTKSFLEIAYIHKRMDYVSLIVQKIMDKLPSSYGIIADYINIFARNLDFCRAETFSNRVWLEIPDFVLEIRMASNYNKKQPETKFGLEEIPKVLDFWMYMGYKYPDRKFILKNKLSKFRGSNEYFPSVIHFIAQFGDVNLLQKAYSFCEKFGILSLCYSAIWNTLNEEKIKFLIDKGVYSPDYSSMDPNKQSELQLIITKLIEEPPAKKAKH